MFYKFKNKADIILLDSCTTTKVVNTDNKIALVLSPALYWVKKVSLPVKYLHEAKKLLPSLFEESIPEGNYSYAVYKKEDYYFAFAYEDSSILELLKKCNIERSRIASIHFAQSVFDEMQDNYAFCEEEVLSVVDGVVVIIPQKWAKDVKMIDSSALKVPKERISLKQFGHIIDRKSLYKIATVVALFMVILMIELFTLQHKVTEIQAKNDALFQNYKLLSTMMQNRAILQNYKKRYEKQSHLRNTLALFLNMSLPKGAAITLLEYTNDRLRCTITGMNAQNVKNIENVLHQKKLTFHVRVQAETLYIEVNL